MCGDRVASASALLCIMQIEVVGLFIWGMGHPQDACALDADPSTPAWRCSVTWWSRCCYHGVRSNSGIGETMPIWVNSIWLVVC